MAKIICITSGLTGILNASFELVRRLSIYGHEMICAGPSSVEEQVLEQGIAFESLSPLHYKPIAVPLEGGVRSSRWANAYNRYKQRRTLQQKTLEITYPDDYLPFLEKHQPDLLLLDLELHEYIIIAHSRNIPVLLINQFFSVWRRPSLPYIMHDIIPGEGMQGTKLGISWSWWKVKINRWIKFNKLKLYSGGTDRRSILLSLAKQEKFPLNCIGENYWPGPILYDRLPVINMVYDELEFPHSKRPDSYYVGPMVYEQRKSQAAKTIQGYTLEEAFAYRVSKQAKLIYCSVSTLSKSDFSFLKKVIKAVETETTWVLIMSIGSLESQLSKEKRKPNIFTFSYVPQLAILAKADCSINHGGMHTINECIHFGVPMLIYSGGKSDQNGTSARVTYHRVGLKGDRQNDGVEVIRENIKKVLSSKVYQGNIAKLQEANNRYQTAGTVEKVIDGLLNP